MAVIYAFKYSQKKSGKNFAEVENCTIYHSYRVSNSEDFRSGYIVNVLLGLCNTRRNK